MLSHKQFKKILIVNLGGIGDFLLSVPALKAMRNAFADARISLLATPRIHDLVKRYGCIDDIFEINLKTLMILRSRKYDIAVNMRTMVSRYGAAKIRFIFGMISPKMRAGRDTDGLGNFFDIKIPEKGIDERHEMGYDLELATALGAEIKDRNIDFEITKNDFENVEKILKNKGLAKEEILIGIHPGGKPSHRWPIENFAEAIAGLDKITNYRFVITGDRQDVAIASRLTKMTDAKIINTTNELSVGQLAALIKMCKIYIANDTGPMHIAAVVKTPLVAIFGPGYVRRFDPRNISDKAVVLYRKVDCAPCNRTNCNSLRCLRSIAPKEVIGAVGAFLKNPKEEIAYADQGLSLVS